MTVADANLWKPMDFHRWVRSCGIGSAIGLGNIWRFSYVVGENDGDVYFGRGLTIILQRERIKRKPIEQRRLLHRRAAEKITPRCARASAS
jgi:hypothetical protein